MINRIQPHPELVLLQLGYAQVPLGCYSALEAHLEKHHPDHTYCLRGKMQDTEYFQSDLPINLESVASHINTLYTENENTGYHIPPFIIYMVEQDPRESILTLHQFQEALLKTGRNLKGMYVYSSLSVKVV